MLIRHQNKKSISNLSQIYSFEIVEMNKSRWAIHAQYNANDYGVLGNYTTEEKAIKVLDMIEKEYGKYITLAGGPALVIGGIDVQPNIFNIPKVFQMPQEEAI